MLRRKLKDLGLSDCVDKNILVQNWFRRVWSLQLVPPADVVREFDLIHQLQAEENTSRTKMLSIRTGSWKERYPGWVSRREMNI